jgi:hypothetical protein
MCQGLRAGVVLPYRATLSVHCLASAGLPWNYAYPFHAKYLIVDRITTPPSQKQRPAVLDKRPDRGPCAKVLFTGFFTTLAPLGPTTETSSACSLADGEGFDARLVPGFTTLFATANTHTLPHPFKLFNAPWVKVEYGRAHDWAKGQNLFTQDSPLQMWK